MFFSDYDLECAQLPKPSSLPVVNSEHHSQHTQTQRRLEAQIDSGAFSTLLTAEQRLQLKKQL